MSQEYLQAGQKRYYRCSLCRNWYGRSCWTEYQQPKLRFTLRFQMRLFICFRIQKMIIVYHTLSIYSYFIKQNLSTYLLNMQKNRQNDKRQSNLMNFFIRTTSKDMNKTTQSNVVQSAIVSRNEPSKEQQIIHQKIKLPEPPSIKKQTNVTEEEQDFPKKFKKKLKILSSSDDQVGQFQEKEYQRAKPQPRQRKSQVAKKQQKQQQPLQDKNSQFTDKTPDWALPDRCMDKFKHKPTDPNYDPTSLHIPEHAWKSMTNTMKQYWKFKSQNYDKIILFKLGKFYELFYEDAFVGNKYLDLKWMGTKMHTGFPEKVLDKYVNLLVNLGFKVVVVQQMETPTQMEERIKKQKSETKGKKVQKFINRDITQILTKGTYTSPLEIQQNYLPNYLISVIIHQGIFAFSLLDTSSNKIILGHTKSFQQFKTMLYQTRPVELLYDPDNLAFQYRRMMTESMLSMIQSKLINKDSLWHPLNAIDQIEKSGLKVLPAFTEISKYHSMVQDCLMSTLSGLFYYLRKILLFENVIKTSKFEIYNNSHVKKQNMILDSQALQHLQLFQTSTGQEQGSLFSKINKCKTKFGKRMLRSWICAPSANRRIIQDRLDAVEDLNNISLERNKFMDGMKKLPDIEKLVNKLYHYSVKSLANKAVYFADVSGNRLKQYRQFLQVCNTSCKLIDLLRNNSAGFRSRRLKRLLTIKEDQEKISQNQQFDHSELGLLPDVMKNLNQFEQYIKWQKDTPIPQPGVVASFDNYRAQIKSRQQLFNQYLEDQRKVLRQANIKFTHTKQRYEIQVSESNNKIPSHYIFSSKRQGFNRYVTKEIRKSVKELQQLQQKLKQQMNIFVTFFFQEFKRKFKIWENFVKVLAELDCLVSNSVTSNQWDSCRPIFIDNIGLSIKKGIHPCLTHLNFIPNDIIMSSKQSSILLTGPNMGGKSTLLRMSCLLAILAQMGIFVPCQKYEANIFDRIFTRIGASDRLLEKKSTFFIEMEQTKSILEFSTPNSLVIMDQLGRGTSTYDGMSIAYATLKELSNRKKCMLLFATHYHLLIEEFCFNQNIMIKHMGYFVDQKSRRLIFLYKLKDGGCDKSFGINVLRAVNISDKIAKKADIIGQIMGKQIRKKRNQAVDIKCRQIMNILSL